MLAGTVGVAAGMTLAGGCKPLERRLTAGKGFKIGVCDWTIGRRANPSSFELAKKIGLDGVQVDFGGGEKELPLFDPGLQEKILAEAERNEMEIASLAMGTLNDVAYKSDPRAEAWVSKAVEVAEAMKQGIILLAFFGNGDLRKDPKGRDEVVRRFRKVAGKAEDSGVVLGIESWLSGDEHLEIIEAVDSPAVRVYYDVANSNMEGHDIYKEIRELGSRICQVHAKDYEDLYGKGSIDFPRVREAMDEIGYRSWLVMEGVKMPLGVEESCRYDFEYLRKIFPSKV